MILVQSYANFSYVKGGRKMVNIRTDITGAKIQSHTRLSKDRIQEVMEKLSSGKRLYSSKVDSAGLAVSTRMTSQIKGNEKAFSNISDGKLLYKTLEGGLHSIEEQLQRMRELTVQLKNGTLANSDRVAIETELNQIKKEIDHTANTLTYNNKKLLTSNGSASLSGLAAGDQRVRFANLPVDTSPGAKTTVQFWMKWDGKNTHSEMPFGWNMGYSLVFMGSYFGFNTANGNALGTTSAGMEDRWVHISATFINGLPDEDNVELYIDGTKMELADRNSPTVASRTVSSTAYFGGWGTSSNYDFGGQLDELKIWNGTRTKEEVQNDMNSKASGTEASLIGYWSFDENSGTVTEDKSSNGNDGVFINGASWGTGVDYLKLHVGADNEEFGTALTSVSSENLGIDTVSYNDRDALKKLDHALNTITKERTKIGAAINRLEIKENNIKEKINQQQISRSRIEDADIAQESSELMKQEVKLQSSMSLLMKNNQIRENTLQLLRN